MKAAEQASLEFTEKVRETPSANMNAIAWSFF
jgi:hypothetical protein